ncbi:MAG: lysozyme-like domain containing protein [Gammaproteobacteria bacterium]|nr:lysozyme-like domain containing protein [Gammaproteobacteria bacterium]
MNIKKKVFVRKKKLLTIIVFSMLLAGCIFTSPEPPSNQSNICSIFNDHPDWYDYALDSEKQWGTSIAAQIAFIKQESSFRHDIRPPRDKLLGVIPWFRSSSAYGYAQAQDAVWSEYEEERGSLFSRRSHMKYATDFIGWYNRKSRSALGIGQTNIEHLYLAYHEGRGGYKRKSYLRKKSLRKIAKKVSRQTEIFERQLKTCEKKYKCRYFFQVWPICS